MNLILFQGVGDNVENDNDEQQMPNDGVPLEDEHSVI